MVMAVRTSFASLSPARPAHFSVFDMPANYGFALHNSPTIMALIGVLDMPTIHRLALAFCSAHIPIIAALDMPTPTAVFCCSIGWYDHQSGQPN
jgi:hypothetical protein